MAGIRQVVGTSFDGVADFEWCAQPFSHPYIKVNKFQEIGHSNV
jgi:hypothetical protein